ncbi:ABC transporter ATP-binding protein [candidate division WWE3 bacterium]|uniref:ABC transporter ATP-binding protein n=1 Tax=candidate division WWE3 bacterium TaxID=2053526 RepID=A0A955LW59_UNCKA|nr:ABC transporter ATP-binding protein [candidate division WWE3 bacterium]
MPVLKLSHITKIYSTGAITIPAISDVSFEVEQGEMVAIMGPSGSGKSTLMNIIGLLDRPTSGKVLIGDEEITLDMSDRKLASMRSDKIGFVFQSFNLLTHLSAFQNVIMPTRYSSLSQNEAKSKAEAILQDVGLGDRMNHKPSELSGGEKQRVAIARALINDPEIVLADEPTGNLDTNTGAEVMSILKELNSQGRTILLITHDPAIAKECDRTIHLLDGRVVDTTNSSSNTESIWDKIMTIVSTVQQAIE